MTLIFAALSYNSRIKQQTLDFKAWMDIMFFW